MKVSISCDADWEAKIDKVVYALSDLNYRRFFEERHYGSSLESILIGLMCQDPELNLKRRIRYTKKEKQLSLDIMLDINQFKQIDQRERNKIVIDKILSEVIPIIKKYKFEDFDTPKFEDDFNKFFIKCARKLEKLAITSKKP